jgi:hypothetical protein
MKARILSDHVQPFRSIGSLLGDQIHFERHEDLIGQIWVLPMQGLATDDDELRLAGDFAGGPQNVINLLLLH